MKCKKAKKKYPNCSVCDNCKVVGSDCCPEFGAGSQQVQAQVDDDKPSCDDCGSQKGKLTKSVVHEQEYPGASVWTYTYHYCSKCIKNHPVRPFSVRENTRGW